MPSASERARTFLWNQDHKESLAITARELFMQFTAWFDVQKEENLIRSWGGPPFAGRFCAAKSFEPLDPTISEERTLWMLSADRPATINRRVLVQFSYWKPGTTPDEDSPSYTEMYYITTDRITRPNSVALTLGDQDKIDDLKGIITAVVKTPAAQGKE